MTKKRLSTLMLAMTLVCCNSAAELAPIDRWSGRLASACDVMGAR